jgi:alpha-1,3-rhamnosyl/mannosyltransferase
MTNELISLEAPGVTWVQYVHDREHIDAFTQERCRIVRLKTMSGVSLRKALRDVPCDRLFVPSGAVAPGVGIPCIPWVHDVAIFEHPEWFGETLFRRMVTTRLFRRGIKSAAQVLAVSEDTQSQLIRLFGKDPSMITVTHEGGDRILASLHGAFLREEKQRAKRRVAERGITQSFILMLGTVEPRKNIPMLINAWQRSTSVSLRPLDLIIGGRDGWKLGSTIAAFDSAKVYGSEGGSRLHRIQMLTDDDRRDLLLAADAVVVPSLHEGFGLTALEAMQAETAVIASNVGGLPEVLQGTGLLLPPHDVDAWAGALSGMFADDEARMDLAREGKARSQGMTWERAAKIALGILTAKT